MIVLEEENVNIVKINEMFMRVQNSLPTDIETSIYYPKLRQLLFNEINYFTKERKDVRDDLHLLRLNVGSYMNEAEIREYLDSLKEKYNNNPYVGLEYHIEATRIDFGVPVFVIIRRGDIYLKKFVFRFRKPVTGANLDGLSVIGTPKPISSLQPAYERKKEE